MSHETKADRRYDGTQHAARGCVQHARTHDDRKDGPDRQRKRAYTNPRDGKAAEHSRGAHGIDQRSAWHLPRKRNQSAGSENKTDVELRPLVGGEINRDKRTKAGLDIGQKKSKPIEAATAGRSRVGRCRQRLPRCRRRSRVAAAAERTAVKLQCDRRQFAISGAAGELRRRFSAECPVHRPPLTTCARAQPGRIQIKDEVVPARTQYAQRRQI
jgi:hypothetical protein